jgi:hypothetical protein
MANNVTLPGAGAVVSTRETADSEHIQQVQLDIGTGTDESPVTAGNPLPVTGPLTDTELRDSAVPVTDAGIPALGQGEMAASLPVAIASDQGDLPTKIKFDDGWGGGTVVSGNNPLPITVMNSSIEINATSIAISAPGGGASLTPTLDTNPYADGDLLWTTPGAIVGLGDPPDASMLRSILIVDADDNGGALDLWFTRSNTSWGSANSAPSISDELAQSIVGRVSIAEGDYYDLGGCKVAYKECALPLFDSSMVYCVGISRGTKTYSASGLYIKSCTVTL